MMYSILLLILGAVVVAIVLALIVLLVFACIRRSPKLALWSVAGAVVATVVVCSLPVLAIYLFNGPYDAKSEEALQQAYASEFGSPPPSGIKVLKARQVVVYDSGGQWLLLEAAPAEIDKFVSMGFKPMSPSSVAFRDSGEVFLPDWWKPPVSRLEFYEKHEQLEEGDWVSIDTEMGVDRSTGQIWVSVSKM